MDGIHNNFFIEVLLGVDPKQINQHTSDATMEQKNHGSTSQQTNQQVTDVILEQDNHESITKTNQSAGYTRHIGTEDDRNRPTMPDFTQNRHYA